MLKVFFTCSYSGREYHKYYDQLLSYLYQMEDVLVVATEDNTYLEVLDEKKKAALEDQETLHYQSIKRAIFEADAVIIENSHESFRLGHEATLAMEKKKPVLVLSLHRDMARYVKHDYMHGAKYNKYSLKRILTNFLIKAEKQVLTERFNMFISKNQEQYVEKQARSEAISKSEYIRRLIENDMAR